ncbi:MAG: XylR family transcriptional regulator [Bryobacteraceae bacterium]
MLRGLRKPSRPRRVALIYDATRAYDLKVMGGVAAYLREGAGWSVYIEETALKDQRLPALASWHGDGIIANFDNPRVVRAVLQSRLPAVAFGSGYGWYDPKFRIPYLFTNNGAIARIAADHLLDRGFRNFAYYGGVRTRINGWSVERERAFSEHVGNRGRECQVYRDRRQIGRNWASRQRALVRWLASLPKPVGLMAENDQRARLVLEGCRSAGLRAPEEVAVIGVDNDELLCQLSTPLLSSVEQGSLRIGYEAAAVLDRIMSGRKPRRTRMVIDPIGVMPRGSTDIFAVEDRKVAEAMRYVWERACDGIQARDVADAVGVSRSGLDAHFKRGLGRTVRAAIRDAQLQATVRLISDTTLSLKEIAGKTGFRSVQHMTTVFRQAFGNPPAEYRRTRFRLAAL